MITDKAERQILQGFEYWEVATEKQDLPLYRAAVGLLKSGLNEAAEPIPYLSGMLALLSYEAGALAFQQKSNDAGLMMKSARIHANTALNDDPHDFRSHLVLTYLAADAITEKVTFDDVVAPTDGAGGILGKIFGTAFKAGQAASTRNQFCNEVGALIGSFGHMTREDPNCRDFLFYSERLSGVAEFCRELGLHKQVEAIYRTIADVDPNNLSYDDVDADDVPEYQGAVAHVCTLAEAYLGGI